MATRQKRGKKNNREERKIIEASGDQRPSKP